MRAGVRLGALAALSALVVPALAHAQPVRVHATDAATGAPVAGAVASLVDSAGRRVAATLGTDEGIATLAPPSTGAYRVRVERTGYAAWLSPDALRLEARAGEPRAVAAALRARSDRLDAIVVQSETRCGRTGAATTPSAAAAALWDEAGKALLSTRLAEEGGRVPLRVRIVERTLATSGAVMHEQASPVRVVTGRPFVTLPAESLNAGGYVRRVDTGLDFYAPDATVLLSTAFASTHCFQALRGEGAQAGLVGVAFEPADPRGLPDVRGTLWLDGGNADLRHVDFEFVNVPAPDGAGTARIPRDATPRGRAEFARTASGAWIVRRWHIRMPVLTRWHSNLASVGSAGSSTNRRPTYGVAELRERAGEAVPLGESAEDRPAAVVAGVAYDSIAGRPLVDAEVTVGGSYRARSDSLGRFRVPLWMAGEYEVRVRHPLLVAAGLGTVGATLPLATGDSLTIAVGLPSAPVLRASRCDGVADPQAALLAGTVLDAAGAAAGDARVLLRLPADAVVQPGARVRVTPSGQVVEAPVDEQGAFRFCRLPPDARGTLTVVRGERAAPPVEVAMPASGALLLLPTAP
jgi:hypothetical protein